jgi:flavin-dependent dehydrogenase
MRHRSARGEETLHADLVVDATGRRSPLPSWLAAAGLPALDEASEPCGVYYCSRFYKLRAGVTPPERETTIGADLGYLKYAIFHGDGGIYSITFAAAPEDKPLRALLREAPFERAARQFPVIARWTEPEIAEPITTVYGMDGLRNTRRSLATNGEPRIAGLVLLGDAAIHTNPLYGRGCTFALLHAWLLADALAAQATCSERRARSRRRPNARSFRGIAPRSRRIAMQRFGQRSCEATQRRRPVCAQAPSTRAATCAT